MSAERTQLLDAVAHGSRGASAADIADELQQLGLPPRPTIAPPQLLLHFLSQVLRNRATVECARTRADAVHSISRYIYQQYNTHKLVAGHDPRLAAMPWRDGGVLIRFDVATMDEPLCLSYARFAVAEAGALALYTGKANPASNNLLGQDHLLLLDVEDLVANYEDGWRIVRESGLRPRGIHYIAGPSSTADIAGHMVFGAHGPRRLHLVLVGEIPDHLLKDAHQRAQLSA